MRVSRVFRRAYCAPLRRPGLIPTGRRRPQPRLGAIAASWLSLARQQKDVDGLLAIWSKAQSAAPIRPAAFSALRGTAGQMGNCLKGGQQDLEIFMSYRTYNRANTADRYRQIAAEYADLSKDTTDPFLRPYYLRIAEGYTVRADGELQAWERQKTTARPPAQTCRSPTTLVTSNSTSGPLPGMAMSGGGGA
jgi:hypothetical protein